MTDPTSKRHDTASSRGDEPREAARDGNSGAAPARRPYQRPSIEKRRSLSHATLISAGGVGGTLAGSGP